MKTIELLFCIDAAKLPSLILESKFFTEVSQSY